MLHINFNETRLFIIVLRLCIFICAPHVVYAQPTNFTLDFETGDLRGWTKTGNAFDYQPTLDDNPAARHRGQPSQHQGKYWIGTYERYRGANRHKPGDIQGDKPSGTLTSAHFTIPAGKLSFLVGGGSSFETRVELVIVERDAIENVNTEKPVKYASGRNSETMQKVIWDISPYAGKTGQIRIVDASSEGWGHINADDFRFAAIPDVTIPGIPASLLERKVEVPDLVRHNVSEAERILNRVKLRLGEITKGPSNQDQGTILRQSPAAHSKVGRGASVDIWVAEREFVEVPNLVGQSIGRAKEILKEARLQIGSLAEDVSNRKPGTVFRQDPIAGTKVLIGSPINLRIAAKGEKPLAKINPVYKKVAQGEQADFGSQSAPEGGIREIWTGPGGQKAKGNSFKVYTDQLNPDTYEIMLEVIDGWGRTDRAKATMEVVPNPIAKYNVTIQADHTSMEEGKSVRFEAALHPPIRNIQYRFNFGDQWSDWTVESELQHAYSSPGMYHAFVIVRKEGKIIAESRPVDIDIYRVYLPPGDRARREPIPDADGRPGIPPWLKWAGIITGLGAVFGAGYYLSTKAHNKKKEKLSGPSIHIRPYKDIGVRQIESETAVPSGFEICLRPVSDKGKQDIEAKGSLIDERREHE